MMKFLKEIFKYHDGMVSVTAVEKQKAAKERQRLRRVHLAQDERLTKILREMHSER